MIEKIQVTKYRSASGQLYDTEAEAKRDSIYFELRDIVQDFFCHGISYQEVAEELADHRAEILEIFRRYE